MEVESRQHRILVVDDDPTIRMTLQKVLSDTGMQVFVAKDGLEGFQRFCEVNPDLVVTDLQMPNKSGYQLCTDIRNSENGKVLPVLVMTGSEDFTAVERSYEYGATDFISKPLNYRLMVNRIRYILRSHTMFLAWQRSQHKLQSLGKIVDNSSSEVYFIDLDSFAIVEANSGAIRNSGYSAGEIAQMNIDDLLRGGSPSYQPMVEARTQLLEKGIERYHLLYEITRKDGSLYPIEGNIYLSEEGNIRQLVCIFEDITQKEKDEQRIRKLAFYDGLTSLPNRELFVEHYQLAISLAQRHNQRVGLLFVDLDNFKHVNDTLGHKAGDELITKVGELLSRTVRESDFVSFFSPFSVARFGGDEFAIMLPALNTVEDAILVAERIIRALARPVELRGREVVTAASIGIVLAPDHGDDPGKLLQRADIAMYQAKRMGKSIYQVFDEGMYSDGLARLELENDLRRAVEKSELTLNFQPKFDVGTRAVCGFESLLRWRRKGEVVPPAEFIEVAEESSLIWDVGRWVIRETISEVASWELTDDDKITFAINLSNKQFDDPELFDFIKDTLEQFDLPAWRIQFEITETVFMSDLKLIAGILDQIRELGCTIALDDFGTGYSSLSYLTRFPIDVLKIDRSFVSQINHGNNNTIISAIVALSTQLNLEVVAEGVETDEQLAYIRQLGVKELQGFIWGKPLPVSTAKELHQDRTGQPPGGSVSAECSANVS